MTPERWQHLKGLLEQLDGVPTQELARTMEKLCAGDEELLRQLEELAREEAGGEPIRAAIADEVKKWAVTERDFQGFGRYQLLRRIGQGGMGAVYEARRTGDFEKRVALKVVKQEFDSDFARLRFQQERQVLANLEHPNISRLLDGGETEDGTPYLVMEFVEGQRIDRYSAGLGREARLELFLKVCGAVEYAHRNLVIHRDLKPANILVTPEGAPKLLDFGIAKLMDTNPDETATLQVLTPSYASPEQLRGAAVSTASDVYSLGVVLYEMLTGRRPYKVSTGTPLEIERAVNEQAPAAPGLGKDLDAILLMALRKEPERRYGTVKELADDIRRHLDTRPVTARPDNTLYRMRKYMRRHWTFVMAALLALAGLFAGLGVALYQKSVAQRRFEQVRKLANSFLFDFDEQIANVPGTVKARELIVSTAREYLDGLAGESSGDPRLEWELAVAYGKLGEVQGSTTYPSLRRPEDGIVSYEKSLALARSLARRNLLTVKQRDNVIRAMSDLSLLYRSLKRYDDARRVSKEAILIAAPASPAARRQAQGELAIVEGLRGDLAGSLDSWEKMVALVRIEVAKEPTLLNRRALPSAMLFLGRSQAGLTRFEDARRTETEGLEVARKLVSDYPAEPGPRRTLFLILLALGDIAGAGDGPSMGNFEEAASRYADAIALLQPKIDADPNDRSSRNDAGLLHDRIAYALYDYDPRRALAHALIAAPLLDGAAAANSEFRAQPRISAGSAHTAIRDFAAAERSLKEAESILKVSGTDTEADLQVAWGRLEAARSRPQDARPHFTRAIDIDERLYAAKSTPANAWALTRALGFLARAVPEAAREARNRIAAVWREQLNRFPTAEYIKQRLAEASQ
jgi:tetratricopeptide (TPR) repeat protein/tRNA A-37 threonylcarbamoyl transferase component Bud32